MASVLDPGGALVPNLRKEDFTVLDDGKPQEIVFVQSGLRPFTVVVLMDFSFSMSNNVNRVKAAAEHFVTSMLPEDTGEVGAFSDRTYFGGRMTNDRGALIRTLWALPTGNPSRFHDALWASVDMLERAGGHKVVLVFTDGDDTASRRTLGDVVAQARGVGVMIYAVGLQSEIFNGQRTIRQGPSGSLRRLADETGGRFFELTKTTEPASTFASLAQELRSVYEIGFTPAKLDGKSHKLEVRGRPGLTVRARRSYVASPDRLTTAN